MIALTGDTRGEDALFRLFENDTIRTMSKNDYLIVLGNCGITAAHTDFTDSIALYRDLPCSVLYIDGAHDDYDLLSDHPLFPWNGGMTQNISRYLTHLLRGQVFTIGGRTFLTMGGSTTPGRRDDGKFYDWWPEQDIFPTELDEAFANLDAVERKVDYVLTCECPTSWKEYVHGVRTPCSAALERLLSYTEYGHWFFSADLKTEIPEHRATALGQEVVVLE